MVQVDPNANPARMRPAVSGEMSEELKKKYGFKGYLKDMISCPDPIKAYLCKYDRPLKFLAPALFLHVRLF